MPMKKIIVFCAAFYFSLNLPSFSQSKMLINYPLADGDLWEYWIGPQFFMYETRKVIGDTLLPNGKLYKKIEITGNLQSRVLQFQRIENHSVFRVFRRFVPPNTVVNEEFLLYNLEVKIGDTWPYPPVKNYDGFLADSGIVRVNKFDSMIFGNHLWKRMTLGSYILPTFETWFSEDVMILDSIGVYQDGFEGGYFQLRGAIIRGKRYGMLTSVNEGERAPNRITDFALNLKNYPNPVINNLHIQFELKNPDRMEISIFNLLGQKVYEFPFRDYGAGTHRLSWNGKEEKTNRLLPNGIYLVSLISSSNQRMIRKFTLLK